MLNFIREEFQVRPARYVFEFEERFGAHPWYSLVHRCEISVAREFFLEEEVLTCIVSSLLLRDLACAQEPWGGGTFGLGKSGTRGWCHAGQPLPANLSEMVGELPWVTCSLYTHPLRTLAFWSLYTDIRRYVTLDQQGFAAARIVKSTFEDNLSVQGKYALRIETDGSQWHLDSRPKSVAERLACVALE